MPTKKKAGGRKRDNEADLAELERLRKQVAEQARKEEENQGKRQVSSRRQRTLVRWDGMFSFFFHFHFPPQSYFIFLFGEFIGVVVEPGNIHGQIDCCHTDLHSCREFSIELC